MDKTFEINDLTFKYDDSIILDKLDFSIRNGSFITIIGPNGSGKSTLLKLMASNLSPDAGLVKLWNKNLVGYSSKDLALNMAVVPQETQIHYDFTVYDIVLMGRHPHINRFAKETEKDLESVRNAMLRTNTWHLKDRSINEISGGERQRVIIAKALAQEPRVILLDEPTSSLDIHHQMEVLALLKELNEETGVTIVIVLHDINLAARFSREVILLHLGRLVTIGKTEEVLTVENLQKAYDMEMIIERNPYTGCLNMIPLSVRKCQQKKKDIRIHVICGGGTGNGLLQTLYEEGYHLSIGVINIGDSDWELGGFLSITMAEETPFSEIKDSSLEKAEELASKADIIIMTRVPIGWGNIKNLQILKNQLIKNKPVYLYDPYNSNEKFDYTDGSGRLALEELKNLGLRFIFEREELLKLTEVNK